MKTIHLLSISAAVALTTLAFSVGCAPAPVQSFEPDDDDDGKTSKKGKNKDDDDEKSSSGSQKTKSSSEKSSSSKRTPPGGDPPGGDPGGEIPGGEIPGPPPGADDAEACFSQCIAGNPAAVQIDNQWLACAEKCGEQDNKCLQTCDAQADKACQQNPSACQLLGQCSQQCFGDGP